MSLSDVRCLQQDNHLLSVNVSVQKFDTCDLVQVTDETSPESS